MVCCYDSSDTVVYMKIDVINVCGGITADRFVPEKSILAGVIDEEGTCCITDDVVNAYSGWLAKTVYVKAGAEIPIGSYFQPVDTLEKALHVLSRNGKTEGRIIVSSSLEGVEPVTLENIAVTILTKETDGISIAQPFTVNKGAKLTIEDSITAAGAVKNEEGGTLTLEGGTLTGSIANSGEFTLNTGTLTGGFINEANGTFTMNGGTVSTGEVQNSGTFTLSNGTLTGGVTNGANAIFTMNGGTVSTGAVQNSGTFTVETGEITSAITNSGEFTMNGGTITGVTGSYAVTTTGTFNMTGGQITGNSAGGVNVGTDAAITLSGNAKITENTKDGTQHNVYLPAGQIIKIGTSGLTAGTDGAKIGVTLADDVQITDTAVQITDKNVTNAESIFTSDAKTNNSSLTYTIEENVGIPQNTTNTAVFLSDVEAKYTLGTADIVYLDTFEKAKEAADTETGGTITLLKNIDGTNAAFSSDGGTTQNNQPITFTGGVADSLVTLDLNGHTINRGLTTATASGNVIAVNGGSVVLTDGSEMGTGLVTGGNNTDSGGGIIVSGGEFTMEGGTVAGNSANSGGGIHLADTTSDTSITMSGTVTVTGNTLSDGTTKSNLNLSDNKVIQIGTEGLNEASRIGITTGTLPTSTTRIQITDISVAGAGTIFSSDKGADSGYAMENRYIAGGSSQAVHHVYSDMVKVMDSAVTVTGALHPDVPSSASADYKGVFIEGRTVTLSPFYMAKYEVTQGEYEKYCKYCGSRSPSESVGAGSNHPAYFLSWYDSIVYCNLRSIDEGLTPVYKIGEETDPRNWNGIEGDASTGYGGPSSSNDAWNDIIYDTTANGYRLPTEAEWEFAARGGDTEKADWNYLFSGAPTADGVAYDADQNSSLDDVGMYYPSSKYVMNRVGRKKANALGLYDMSGNIREWCWDWYSDSVDTGTETDPTGPSSGTDRVVRGGSFITTAKYCTVAHRSSFPPTDFHFSFGFRIVRSVTEP